VSGRPKEYPCSLEAGSQRSVPFTAHPCHPVGHSNKISSSAKSTWGARRPLIPREFKLLVWLCNPSRSSWLCRLSDNCLLSLHGILPFKKIFLFYMYKCFPCICACASCACTALRGQKGDVGSPATQVVLHYVGVGNWTLQEQEALLTSPLNHFSSPSSSISCCCCCCCCCW